MNVEMFALYIFSRYSRFRNIRQNMFIAKITFIVPYRPIDNNIKNANIDLREIANFRKFAKMYVHAKISTFTVNNVGLYFDVGIITGNYNSSNVAAQSLIFNYDLPNK